MKRRIGADSLRATTVVHRQMRPIAVGRKKLLVLQVTLACSYRKRCTGGSVHLPSSASSFGQ